MRDFTLIVMLVTGLSVPGCNYVSRVWDSQDKLVDLQPGQTTKAQVFDLLGPPDASFETSNTYRYEGWGSVGALSKTYSARLWTPSVYGGYRLTNKTHWWILVTFDEEKILKAVETRESWDW